MENKILTVKFTLEDYRNLTKDLYELLDTLGDLANDYVFDFLYRNMNEDERITWVTTLYKEGNW